MENSLVTLLNDLNKTIRTLNETVEEATEGRATLKKTNMVVESLAGVVGPLSHILNYFAQKDVKRNEVDEIYEETMTDFEDTLYKHDQNLRIAENKIQKLECDAKKSDNQNGVPKTSKNQTNSNQEENSIPESLLLDHIQTVDSERSTVTIFGIPNRDLRSSHEETGKRIVGEVMDNENFQVKSVKHVKNTKTDKPDTFRLLVRFPSPSEAQKFVGRCGKTVKWSYRLGMTKLERHYSKETVLKISEMNKNLPKDCDYKYIRKGLFSIVRSSS